jgi:hypothetical protein
MKNVPMETKSNFNKKNILSKKYFFIIFDFLTKSAGGDTLHFIEFKLVCGQPFSKDFCWIAKEKIDTEGAHGDPSDSLPATLIWVIFMTLRPIATIGSPLLPLFHVNSIFTPGVIGGGFNSRLPQGPDVNQ